MRAFMDEDFLLSTDTAKTLYHDYAEKMPIVDYHCHLDPQEIYEDRQFDNIAQLWLGVGGSHAGDHYKWRFMRSCGVEERFITGTEPDALRFQKWAECLGRAVGNPLFHWSHLELRRYFGYEGVLNGKTWETVWKLCNEKLRQPEMRVRGLIRQSNVRLICTTDDPVDSLKWHEKLACDKTFAVKVLPAWRPDKAMKLERPDYLDYLIQLEETVGRAVNTFADLKAALRDRMDYFAAHGCVVSDHGLSYVEYAPAAEDKVEFIFRQRRAGILPTSQQPQHSARHF